MALEDLTGTKYPDSLVAANPANSDNKSEGAAHIRGIKNVIKTTFPNISGAITATEAELNVCDGLTASTAELNKMDGLTATTSQLNQAGALADGATAGTALTTGDEGSGNGLDADTVDGQQPGYYTTIMESSNSTVVLSGAWETLTVTCPLGQHVISGGFDVPSTRTLWIEGSYRLSDTQWSVRAYNSDSVDQTLVAYAYSMPD